MGKRNLVTKKRESGVQKKKEQEEAAAYAFEDFVSTFHDIPSKSDKVWVKAGTYDAGRRQEDTREKGKLYKPQSRLSELADKLSSAERAEDYARLMSEKKPDTAFKKRNKDEKKKKSNLEIFKDELKLIQEEREDRHKYKGAVMSRFTDDGEPGAGPPKYSLSLEDTKSGSHDLGDPNTTNLYLGNLNPKITQQQLMEVFGKYGPLASIKIMWPRSDEERARGRHTGFVAFMTRRDGERAMKGLKGKEVLQHEMKLGWGKTVALPSRPIYIPPAMLELSRPPPPSGLPFNCQPSKRHKVSYVGPSDPYPSDLDRILRHGVVKVVIPNERLLLMTIHRMVEFVIREGPMFEAMIMNREINNPLFHFLFENQSPAHVYYRWKLFSLLQGDSFHRFRTEEFRMFSGGSVWRPPALNANTMGMPDELIQDEETEPIKGSLSVTQRDRLEDLLRNITHERVRIAETMVFCIEHAEAADEICECIGDSLSSVRTAVTKKIARLYLISDILHNASVKIANVSYYRRGFEARLVHIFDNIHAAYNSLDSRLKAEGFKLRVLQVVRAWEEWAVYPKEYLIRLQNIFLGLANQAPAESLEPANQEDLDGVPLVESAAPASDGGEPPNHVDEDIDGVPLDEDIDGMPMKEEEETVVNTFVERNSKLLPSGFVPSKWESVDPEQVEAQAMTTSRWETMAAQDDSSDNDEGEEPSSYAVRDQPLNEEQRARLRDIEVKVVQYQDELESGSHALKPCWTVAQQVEHYRRKLQRKDKREHRVTTPPSPPSPPPPPKKTRARSKHSSSPPRSRHSRAASPSPPRSKHSRASPSPPRSKHSKASPSPPRSKHSRAATPSPPRSRHSRAASPSPPRSKHSRASPSPPRSKHSRASPSPPRSKHSRAASPSPPRSKHSRVASPSPPRSKHSRVDTPSPPRIKRRSKDGSPPTKRKKSSVPTSPPRVKRRGSASPPARKHKHRR